MSGPQILVWLGFNPSSCDYRLFNGSLTKLGVEFETFRHDTKITLDMLSELMARTGRHEKDIAALKNRTGRVEMHLKLRTLPDDQ